MRVDIESGRAQEGYVTVTPHGSLNASTSKEFEEAVRPWLEPPVKVILLDMHDVVYVSSAGLQVLFAIKKALTERGGDLTFSRLQPQIVKLFQIVNALPKESIFASVEEADRYFYSIMNRELGRQREGA